MRLHPRSRSSGPPPRPILGREAGPVVTPGEALPARGGHAVAAPGPTRQALESIDDLPPISRDETRVERSLPWVISAGLHALLIAVGMLVPWSTRFFEDDRRQIVRAEFEDLTPVQVIVEAVDRGQGEDESNRSPVAEARALAPPSPLDSDRELLDQLEQDLALSPATPLTSLDDRGSTFREDLERSFAPRSGGEVGSVSFAGLHGTDARNIAFVVDASGSMLTFLPIVIDELTRSIDRLGPSQRLSVIFFQENRAIVVPPPASDPSGSGRRDRTRRGREAEAHPPGTPPPGRIVMLPATESNKLHIYRWIDLDTGNLRARGQSNPTEAIRVCLERLDPPPDVVFLLSTDITGMGDHEVDQADLLSMIARLNRGPRGTLKSTIKTIQFIEHDALDTLKRIAEMNGGPEGYRFLSREELRLDPAGP